jgi:hypothetical protein
MTVISSKFERLRFAICRNCFEAEIDMHYIGHVECSGRSVESP